MFKRTILALAAVAAGASAYAGERYTGEHPHGDQYGLVEAICGDTTEVWPFRPADSGSIGGTVGGNYTTAVTVSYPDNPIVVNNTGWGDEEDKKIYTTSAIWGPEALYRIEVWGQTVTTLRGFTPNATYIVETHFSETYNATQDRVFRCKANGVTVVCGVKPCEAGGTGVAHAFSAEVQADAEGKIVFTVTNYRDNGVFSGYAVWGTSAPSWTGASVAATPTDVLLSWQGAKDVHRFYIEKATSEDGPWANVATLVSSATSYSIPGAYDPDTETYWRVVASNGVGTVTQTAKLGGAGAAVDYTDLATLGETVASDASANYRVNEAGTGDLNKLGAATTEAAAYVNGYAGAHTLAIASGETLKAGSLGVLAGAGDMTVGDAPGQGAVSALGGTLTLNVAEGKTLTVNAPVRKTADTDMIVKYGAGTARLAGGTDVSLLAVGVGTLELPYDTDASFDKTLTGAGTFVKSGAGTLTVANENRGFAGTFEVKEGRVLAGADGAAALFGDGKGTIKVDAGATLDVGNPNAGSDNNVRFGATKIVFEGTGANGAGALANSSGRNQYNAFTEGSLSGDATVNAAGRFDFRGGRGVDLNGHTLTKQGNGMFVFTALPVNAGETAAKIRIEAGSLGAEESTAFNGTGSFELANGAAFDFYNLTAPVAWPLSVESTGGRFTCRLGNYDDRNKWTGPISIAQGGTFHVQANDNCSVRISGAVTGGGALSLDGGGWTGRLCLDSADNAWTGGTAVSSGVLYFPFAAALPRYGEPGAVTIGGTGKLQVKAGDGGAGGWSAEQIGTLFTNATAPADGRGSIVIDTDGYNIDSGAGTVEKPIGIGKSGAGTYTVQMTYTAGGGIYVDQGTLKIENTGVNTFGYAQVVRGGRLEVTDAELDFGDNETYLGTVTSDERPRIVLGNGAVWHNKLEPAQTAGKALKIGAAENGFGVLEVLGGAVISNRISMADAKYGSAAVIQRGGEIVNWAGHSCDGRIAAGERSYGYWEVGGGDTYFMGYSQVAAHPQSAGILAVKGGNFHQMNELLGQLGLSRGGTGEVYVASGRFTSVADVYLGENNDNGGAGGMGVFTMAGGEAEIRAANGDQRWIRLGNRNNFHGQVNLNGGVMSVASIYKDSGGNYGGYVTFNGGTYRIQVDGKYFFGDPGYHPDAVYVYAKGAAIDTDGKRGRTDIPFQAPPGRGVYAIRWNSGDRDMIGPPHVTIMGGGGTGATAIADYDSTTHKVKGIIITCPGWGYTSTPSVALYGGGIKPNEPVTVPAADVVLGDNATGPLVKKGEGTLLLSRDNTFKGIEVRGGVLEAEENATFRPGPLTLAGGTFSVAGYPATGLVVEGDADTVSTLDTPLAFRSDTDASAGAGLYTAFRQIANDNEYDPDFTATEEEHLAVVSSLEYADASLGEGVTIIEGLPYVNKNLLCAYDGYIWNRSGENAVWTFAEIFDDAVCLAIDDVVLFNDRSWNKAAMATVTLAPGPHKFHLVVHQSGGGSGPAVNSEEADGMWLKDAGMGVCVDFQGRGEKNAANFQKLADPGDGSLFTLTAEDVLQAFVPDATVHVNGGTLKVAASKAGLYGGFVPGGGFQAGQSLRTGVYPDLDYAQTMHAPTDEIDGIVNASFNYAFEGYIWNHGDTAVVWTFCENFDDEVYLAIDGVKVLDNNNWNVITTANFTLAPGPHAIRIGLHQNSANSGPSNQGWLVGTGIGIGVDFQGRNKEAAENYVKLTAWAAGGDKPILTTGPYLPGDQVLPADAAIAVSGGGAVDLDEATVTVNDLYTAAAAFANGTLKVDGDWTIDVADAVAGRAVAVKATLDLADAQVVFTGDATLLDKNTVYTLAQTGEGGYITGVPTSKGLPRGWVVRVRDGKVILSFSGGSMIYLR